jgi:hypothetical protein
MFGVLIQPILRLYPPQNLGADQGCSAASPNTALTGTTGFEIHASTSVDIGIARNADAITQGVPEPGASHIPNFAPIAPPSQESAQTATKELWRAPM